MAPSLGRGRTVPQVTGGVPAAPTSLPDLPTFQMGEQTVLFLEALTIKVTAPIPLFSLG